MLERDDPSTLTRALDVLARATPDHLELKTVLSPVLISRLETLCRLATQQAARVRGRWHTAATTTLAGALTRTLLIAPVGDHTVLTRAYEQLPSHRDLVLGVLSLVVDDQLVTSYRELPAANRAAYEPALALSLRSLSVRLAEAGRRGEALTAIEEAVTSYRERAAANPARFRDGLASSLQVLGWLKGEVGDNE